MGRCWGTPILGGAHVLIENASEYIQNCLVLRGAYEPLTCWLLRRLLRQERGGVFFDVGANLGLHSLVALAAGARVVAFEPLPRLADHLRRNLTRNRGENRARVVTCAVSDQAGTAPFYVATRPDDGSHSLVPGVTATHIEEIRVKTVTLDQYCKDHPDGLPDVVKIDVEGFEARVLDGARRLLASDRPPYLLIETADRLAANIGESAAAVLARLLNVNYRLLRIREYPAGLVHVDLSADLAQIGNYLAIPPWARLDVGPLPRFRVSTAWLG